LNEPELKDALNRFDKLLKDHHEDNLKSVVSFKSFIRNFLRVRTNSIVLPTSEIMTIIKHERPNIYSHLKRNLQSEPLFELLTQIEVGYDNALNKLNVIREEIE
jgi:hypothetical protein